MDTNESQDESESKDDFDRRDVPEATTALDLLANSYRRIVLEYLVERTESVVTFDRLVEHVLEHEARTPGKGPTAREVRMELYHVHLPKLSEFGLLNFDGDDTVEYSPDPTVEYLVELSVQLDEETTSLT